MDDLSSILPRLTEAQERVLDIAIRYWKVKYSNPQDIRFNLSFR